MPTAQPGTLRPFTGAEYLDSLRDDREIAALRPA